VNLVQDVLLHGGGAWNDLPQSRGDVLFVLGASSLAQDEPERFVEGEYRLVGEVVSTERIDETLPDGAVLLVYDLERRGDIDYESLREDARSIIGERTQRIGSRLRPDPTSSESTPTERTGAVSANETAEFTFGEEATGDSPIDRLAVNANVEADGVPVTVSALSALPNGTPELPGRQVRALNISVGLDDDEIEQATFDLTLAKGDDYDGGELTVYRYHDGSWDALETTVSDETDARITLTVETPGFSYFAVRETTPEQPSTVTANGVETATPRGTPSKTAPKDGAGTGAGTATPTSGSDEPVSTQEVATASSGTGFSVIGAFAGLIAVSLLALLRRP
jgi:PGF-pre-PGF domain-containing protein